MSTMLTAVLTDTTNLSTAAAADLDIQSGSGGGALVLDDNMALILQWILFPVLCQTIDIFGTGTNIVNIICFVKQGFNDPVNVSLLGKV